MTNQFTRNMRTGIRWGLFFAIIFSVIATIVVLARGADLKGQYGVTYPELVVTYFLGGLIGGVLAGALLPLANGVVGSVLVGFVVALPISFAICFQIVPKSDWGNMFPVLPLVGAGIIGPLGASAIRIGRHQTK